MYIYICSKHYVFKKNKTIDNSDEGDIYKIKIYWNSFSEEKVLLRSWYIYCHVVTQFSPCIFLLVINEWCKLRATPIKAILKFV